MKSNFNYKNKQRVFGLEVALAFFGGARKKKHVFLAFKGVICALKDCTLTNHNSPNAKNTCILWVPPKKLNHTSILTTP
jgi:hypothetical protein